MSRYLHALLLTAGAILLLAVSAIPATARPAAPQEEEPSDLTTATVSADLVQPMRAIVHARGNHFVVDSVPPLGSPSEERNPLDMFLGSLATCGLFIFETGAAELEIDLESLSVSVEGDLAPQGVRDGSVNPRLRAFRVIVDAKGISQEEFELLKERFESRCPIYTTLIRSAPIEVMDVAAAKIRNAMSAAPPVIAEGATIVDWPAGPGDEPPLLRAGSSDWLCLPDNANTPGNDPMCVDPTWAAWMNAYMTGTEPEVNAPGIAYMLAGGSDASNSDPYATGPAEGEDWVDSGPHIMLLMPGGFDPAAFSTDHTSGGPYIMWEGTPYEHLMVPVVAAADAAGPIAVTDSTEAKIGNVMGAAPATIAGGATILDWPAEPGGDMAMLQAGENGWTCVPDWPATPDNDPMCFDPTYFGWMGAFMAGAQPEVEILGVSYMLSGGAAASNTDPSLMEPPAGADWVVPPPHVMLVAPGGFDAAYFSTDDTWGGPWIMWDDTPYEFLIVPIE